VFISPACIVVSLLAGGHLPTKIAIFDGTGLLAGAPQTNTNRL
jgi:hypothetical protein